MTSQIETKNRGRFSGLIFVFCATFRWRESRQIETAVRAREAFRLGRLDRISRRNFTADNLRVRADSDGLRAFKSPGPPSDLDRGIKQICFRWALINESPLPIR
jgi:hypothetical protein